MVRDIKEQFDLGNLMVVSPDVGGVVRARGLAKRIDAPLAIVDKRRERAGESEVMNIIGDVEGHTCILIDDIVDSGGTLFNAADALLAQRRQGRLRLHHPRRAVRRRRRAHRRLEAERAGHHQLDPADRRREQAGNIRLLSIAGLIGEAISAHRRRRVGVEPVRLTSPPDSRQANPDRRTSRNANPISFCSRRASVSPTISCGRRTLLPVDGLRAALRRFRKSHHLIRAGHDLHPIRPYRGSPRRSRSATACQDKRRPMRAYQHKQKQGSGRHVAARRHYRFQKQSAAVVEDIAAANDWAFERSGEDEITIVSKGDWTDYQLTFTWMGEIEALHLACAFDMKIPAARRSEVQRMIAAINEQLWVGHFDIWTQTGMIMYRQALVLPDGLTRLQRAMRSDAGRRHPCLRALLSGVAVRGLGRQVRGGGDERRDVRHRGRGVTPPDRSVPEAITFISPPSCPGLCRASTSYDLRQTRHGWPGQARP